MERIIKASRKIVAIGRNYAEHAKELGGTVPSSPLFFLKPSTSFLLQPGKICVPASAPDVHHEVELAVIIGARAKRISASNAWDHVAGYALALDMTARTLQRQAIASGTPWAVSKGFDTFTPIGEFIPKSRIPNPDNLILWCKVDGEMKQWGKTSDMVFKIPQLIEYVSSIMTLEEHDVILTGTPSGVGPVKPNQTIQCGLMETVGTTPTNLTTVTFGVL